MSLLQRWITREESRRVYWWRPNRPERNIGDELAHVVTRAALDLRDKTLLDKTNPSQRLFAIGSVLHNAKDGDAVWGSGINGKIPAEAHRFRSLDVRAVRGPLTREFLMARNIAVPEVYGDPALLLPMLYPRALLGVAPRRPFVVVPHFNEAISKYQAHADCLVLPTSTPMDFVRQLLEAELIVSSSLHGVIIAEAYGVPAVYLDSGNGENRFKYDDYYRGTGRETWHFGSTVDECLALGGNAEFDVEAVGRGLLDAFPYDLWP